MGVWALVEQIIAVLKDTKASKRHLIFYIAVGLEKMLRKCKEWGNKNMDDSSLWDVFLRAGGETPEDLRQTFLQPMPQAIPAQQQQPVDDGMVGAQYSHAPGGGGGFIYGGIPANQLGNGGVYMEQQYFPVGIYDFLTTQMPG